MVRYGLAKVLTGVKAPQTRKNLFLQGFVSHSEKFKVNFVVVVT